MANIEWAKKDMVSARFKLEDAKERARSAMRGYEHSVSVENPTKREIAEALWHLKYAEQVVRERREAYKSAEMFYIKFRDEARKAKWYHKRYLAREAMKVKLSA